MCVSGKFIWKKIGEHFIPTIMRNENEYFMATRMVQRSIELYLSMFHKDVYNMCLNIDSYYISESEATLLTCINEDHCNKLYGEEKFLGGKDYLVGMKDVQQLLQFFKTFHIRLTNQQSICDSHYGFLVLSKRALQYDGGMAIPFCEQDGDMYAPASFIDLHFGNVDQIPHIELNRWSAAYLKMCYLTMRLDKESMYQDNMFSGIKVPELVRCLDLYQPITLWIDSDHLVKDIHNHDGPEIEHDIWFNKPGVRVMQPLDSASWGEVIDAPQGLDLPDEPESAPGLRNGLNVVVNGALLKK